jgi:hypothetical protein
MHAATGPHRTLPASRVLPPTSPLVSPQSKAAPFFLVVTFSACPAFAPPFLVRPSSRCRGHRGCGRAFPRDRPDAITRTSRTHRGHAVPSPHEPQPRNVQHASRRHPLDHEHPHYTVAPRTPRRLRGQGTALCRDPAERTTPALLAPAHAHGVGKRTHASLPEHTVWPPPVTAVMAPRTRRCRCSSMHAAYTHAARPCHDRCRTGSAPGPCMHSTPAVTVRRALP